MYRHLHALHPCIGITNGYDWKYIAHIVVLVAFRPMVRTLVFWHVLSPVKGPNQLSELRQAGDFKGVEVMADVPWYYEGS